jgi:hypothetical protein
MLIGACSEVGVWHGDAWCNSVCCAGMEMSVAYLIYTCVFVCIAPACAAVQYVCGGVE